MNIVEGEIKGPARISWCGTEWRENLTKDIVDREIRKHDKGGESMNKKLKAIALTLCLALSLVASVSAIEITEGDMITRRIPTHLRPVIPQTRTGPAVPTVRTSSSRQTLSLSLRKPIPLIP